MSIDQLVIFINNILMNKVDTERLKSIRAFWLGSLVINFLIQQHKLSAPTLYRADAAKMPIYKLPNLDARESLESPRQITVVKHGKIKRILLDSRSRSGTNFAFAFAFASACGVALISLGPFNLWL
jgi:hypothetical protein